MFLGLCKESAVACKVCGALFRTTINSYYEHIVGIIVCDYSSGRSAMCIKLRASSLSVLVNGLLVVWMLTRPTVGCLLLWGLRFLFLIIVTELKQPLWWLDDAANPVLPTLLVKDCRRVSFSPGCSSTSPVVCSVYSCMMTCDVDEDS